MFIRTNILIMTVAMCVVPIAHASSAKLAYIEYVNDLWQVQVKNIKSGTVKKLLTTDYDVSRISIDATGKKMFVCGIQSEASLIDLATGKSEAIKLPFNSVNDAVISPDGKHLVFSYIAPGSPDNKLWMYDIANKKATAILKDLPGRQFDPAWSADGQSIVFTSGAAGIDYAIKRYHITKKTTDTLVHNNRLNLDATISRDGKLAYSSNQGGGYDIWAVEDMKLVRVTKTDVTESKPSWSADGKTVYFETVTDGVVNVWKKDYSGSNKSKATQITFSQHGARQPLHYVGTE